MSSALQLPSTLRLGASNGSTTIRLANLGSEGPLLLTYGEEPVLFTNSTHTIMYSVLGTGSIALSSNSNGSAVVNVVGDVINLQAGQIALAGNLTLNNAAAAMSVGPPPPLSPSPSPPPGSRPPPPPPAPPPPFRAPPAVSQQAVFATAISDGNIIDTYYKNDTDSGNFTQVSSEDTCPGFSCCCLCALLVPAS